jgi:tetratricopeptide (TPR) repeat protein
MGHYRLLQEPDSSFVLWKKASALAEEKIMEGKLPAAELKTYKNLLASTFVNIGYICRMQGRVNEALDTYKKSLKLLEETGNKSTRAIVLNNIGDIYENQGNIEEALKCYNESLKIKEGMGDKKAMIFALSNLGLLYKGQGYLDKALEYYERSLKLAEEIRDKVLYSSLLINIGKVYQERGQLEIAVDYYDKCLKIKEEIQDKKGIASVCINIGYLYFLKNDFKEARRLFDKSLAIFEEIRDRVGLATALNNISGVYLKIAISPNAGSTKQAMLELALTNIQKSMKMSQELGFPDNIKFAAHRLWQIYKLKENHKAALENYELYIKMNDSLTSAANKKASLKSQLKYEYEKQAAKDSVAHAKEKEISQAELGRQRAELTAKRNQQYALYGGLILVMVFAGFMYNRFKITKKQKYIIEEKEKETTRQNEIISQQKDIVEVKQKEILDSIYYARRIQQALITNEKYVSKEINRLKKA